MGFERNCSFCGNNFTSDTEYDYDYDISTECEECSKKMKWFVYGLITGMAIVSLVFYMFWKAIP